MGRHKRQEKHQLMDDLPQGEGKCTLCGKTVHSLRDHMMDQHKGERLPK